MSETAYSDSETEAATEADNAAETGKASSGGMAQPPQAQPAQFDDLHDSGQGGDSDVNLDVILDVGVTLSMEVGRVRIPIRNLLQLSQGSVVELDRLAGEPLDVFVNGTLIAHGEVVMVNDKFGVRLTDVVSPAERIRKLR